MGMENKYSLMVINIRDSMKMVSLTDMVDMIGVMVAITKASSKKAIGKEKVF
jgi:hypothetical protein